MVKNLQAHEGAITCMEAITDIDDSGFQILETNSTLVTGGQEKSLKVWSVKVKPGHSGNKIILEQLVKVCTLLCNVGDCILYPYFSRGHQHHNSFLR